MKPLPRSPYQQLEGAYHLPRFIDKARAFLTGEMERDYRMAFGNRRGVDGQFLTHFDLKKKEWLEVVETHLDDESVGTWFASDPQRIAKVASWNKLALTLGLPGSPMHETFTNFARPLYDPEGKLPGEVSVFNAICFDEGYDIPETS